MKILLVFTLYLITGSGNSFEVIGYSGGSVIIQSDLQWSLKGAKYICRARNGCVDLINDQSGNKNIYEKRFSLHENREGKFTVWIRDLTTGDAAKYEFGVKEEKSKKKEIELKVEKDCCGGTKVLNVYLGENVTVECKYPDLFEENDKVFFKLENRSITEIINTGKQSQKVQSSRFSISEDRSSKVFSVRISDVREEDGGVYYCGVWKKQQSDGFYSLYRELQLQVTGSFRTMSTPPVSIISPEGRSSSSVIIIITVCVCVALLLVGGSALIYTLTCKKTHENFRMKILLLVFTLYLITGSGNSLEVIGYSGGSVIIQSDLQWNLTGAKYICKARNGCVDIIKDQSGNKRIDQGRFSLHETREGKFTVWIRDLTPRDAATYEFGVKEENSNKSKKIELKVEKDCCGGRKVLNVYLGENVTVECKYPDLFEENDKVFFKLENRSITEIINTGKQSQKVQSSRFSFSEDRSSKVFSVRISDVREEDGGVYYCGVWKKQQPDSFYSLYTEIQLQATGSFRTMSTTPMSITSPEGRSRSFRTMSTPPVSITSPEGRSTPGSTIIIIITVCVSVALLLIIAFAVIIYCVKRKKREGSTSSSTTERKDHKQDPSVVCNYAEVKKSRNASPPTNTSDEDDHSAEPPTEDSSPAYATVSFQKNPAVPTDATVTLSKEEPATLYGAVRHGTGLE
ncbi:hypothetical protein MHYP_G00103870 [Metynnis hypsauchen]